MKPEKKKTKFKEFKDKSLSKYEKAQKWKKKREKK